jgi:hypothetical protein
MRENDEWCKRALVYVLRLTIAWVGVCATCLLSLWCASVERWDNRRQWRRSSEFVPMDRGRWRMNWMLEPRDRGPVDGPWIASTWRRRQASVHAKSRRCSPKSRQQLTKSRRLHKDLVIGWLRTSGDTHRDCVGGVADTRLQLGLAISTSKPRGSKFDAFGPQSSEDLGATRPHVASSETLKQGEASSWRDCGRPMFKTQLGPFRP